MKKNAQLEFKKINGWGGAREGAGRKNRSGRKQFRNREPVDFRKPLHLTLRLRKGLCNLRTPAMLGRFKKTLKHIKGFDLHPLHFALEGNHLHLFVEAKNNQALTRGMKSLGCRFGKAVRKVSGGEGPVFDGPFHLHVMKTPREVKHGLRYVLLNHAKHANLIPYRDEFSSALHFGNWRELLGRQIGPILAQIQDWISNLPDHLSAPQSWLAREGWQRAS